MASGRWSRRSTSSATSSSGSAPAFYFNGVIDAVRISEGARYSSDFTPSASLSADGDTLAAWGMDEGAGAALGDETGAYDGSIRGASWSSACDAVANSAPTAPTVSVDPSEPVQTEALTCAVTVASADADGDAVDYNYEWYLDGAWSGLSGAALSADYTRPGDQWSCRVTPNDGGVDGPTGTGSVEVSACYALQLDGAHDYAVLRDDLSWSQFTIEAWINPADVDTFSMVLSDINNSAGHYFRNLELGVSGGHLIATLGKGSSWESMTSSASLTAGEWTHVALTYDGATAQLMVNGVLDTSASLTLVSEETPVYLGARPVDLTDTAFFFNGEIDALRISDVARYTADFTPDETLSEDDDTVALWSLNEGEGATVGDGGALVGGTWVESCVGH